LRRDADHWNVATERLCLFFRGLEGQLAGQKDQLIGKLQERYGYEKSRAEREVDDFVALAKRRNANTGGASEATQFVLAGALG
jgi:hypothetical protein